MNTMKTAKGAKVLGILNIVAFGLGLLTIIFTFVDGIFFKEYYVDPGGSSYGYYEVDVTVFFGIGLAISACLTITVLVFAIMYLVGAAKLITDSSTKALALVSSIMYVSIFGLNLIFMGFGGVGGAFVYFFVEIAAFVITIITGNRLRKDDLGYQSSVKAAVATQKTVVKQQTPATSSLTDKLHELDSLKQKGLIDAKEYQAAKAALLKKTFE